MEAPIGGDPGLKDIERKQRTLDPGRSDGGFQGIQKVGRLQRLHCFDRPPFHHLGQNGAGRLADHAGVAAKPDLGNFLILIQFRLDPDPIAAERIHRFVPDVGVL